jgi:hypothetical protein
MRHGCVFLDQLQNAVRSLASGAQHKFVQVFCLTSGSFALAAFFHGVVILFAAFDVQARPRIEMTHVDNFLGTYNTVQDAEAAVFA